MGPDAVLDTILLGLGYVYGKPWVVPFIFLPVMLAVAGYLHWEAWRKAGPFLSAAQARTKALAAALGEASDPVTQRAAFSESFIEVAQAMDAPGRGAVALVQAWREFHESIVDETASPIRNTNRPSLYFLRAGPRQTTLVFASNVFVGVGLILTFLGLVVALHTAAEGMRGDASQSKLALTTLLTVAGAKFFTSIGGLVASLWLRFAEHRLTRRINAATDAICTLLERGMLYVPPQRLAVEQLEVMREQRDELKSFNTDLALQIGDRVGAQFQQAMAPVSVSLSQLNDNISAMGEGLGQGAAKAVAEASGGELRVLGQTLATLSERLDALSATVGNSGDEAARQIRAAGEDFARAATEIRAAFDRLVGEVDGMGGRLAAQGEAVAQAQSDVLGRVLTGLEDAQRASQATVTEAVKALQTAAAEAAESLQARLEASLSAGVEASQRTFEAAMEASGEGLRSTAAALSRAVGEAADQIERAGSGFERSGQSATRTAESLDEVAGHARAVATSIGDAAKGFASAAAPVAQASQAITEAAGRIARSIEAGREVDAEALRGLSELAEGIRATQEAAESAWLDYRERFEGVDKALESTAVKLGETLGDTFNEFRRFAQDTDRELGAAVSKLSQTLTTIEEYAEALNDHVESQTRAPRMEPAE